MTFSLIPTFDRSLVCAISSLMFLIGTYDTQVHKVWVLIYATEHLAVTTTKYGSLICYPTLPTTLPG